MLCDEVVIITGPTACGKTDLSLALAERWGAEIISADSRQVYRELDIGTAKPTAEERARAPHHLIDVRDPGERFTVADFRDECLEAIEQIRSRGRVPLIVGGTCMYLHALLHGFDFGGADRDPDVRDRLQRRIEEEGSEVMHAELARLAPDAAERISPGDARRITRALELIELTGRPIPGMTPENSRPFPYKTRIFALYFPREILYDRINKRVVRMYNNGLVEEANRLLRGSGPELAGFLRGIIGYSQALDLLENRVSGQDSIDAVQRETRRYAKRQLTWLRRMGNLVWLNAESGTEGMLPLIERYTKREQEY